MFDNRFEGGDWTMSPVGWLEPHKNHVLLQNLNSGLVVHWNSESPKKGELGIIWWVFLIHSHEIIYTITILTPALYKQTC